MESGPRQAAGSSAARRVCRSSWLVAAAFALSGCVTDQSPTASLAQPRGATVAFESIDGPPVAQFRKLVQDLNDEAQTRRLAVLSRESPSSYRVRGYLAVAQAKDNATVSWVWDVFDAAQQRTLRIDGEETVKGKHHDTWTMVDDAMLQRIAHSSMDQLAAFLTSPGVAPPTPPVSPAVALVGNDVSSPEEAGIFRIFHPHADPVSGGGTEAPADAKPADTKPAEAAPPQPPPASAAVSANESLILAASSH